ncbi:putative universal stress protein [Methanimicrococcus sp. At1]|uniref:Universal stress protein n=1 Tax=Methanimicrococcus hacksteinii TaxID=3028293 RepID=A0ABU3VNM8_9EURY|nr:universal stress protein [Methanimicrococcus sp. At1]MDV0444520.1 putative universal stress protein [Methanimicrococcus sp. At1]
MTGNLYNTIIVGTDGTEYAKKAINMAVGLAKLTDAKLHAVYVSDVSNITPTSVEWEMVAENIKLESEAAFEFVRERAAAENVNFETASLSGAAAQELVQYANQVNADLIVVGATGKKAFERLILGSVSEKVIRNAKQPVLVVRSENVENE